VPTFRYQAATEDGREQAGVVEADSPRAVRALLRTRGLVALTIAAIDDKASSPAAKLSISTGELALITRQYASLLSSGLTVERALDALVAQTDSPKVGEILAGIRAEVRGGHALAQAMGRYPRAFPDLYRALIRGGEDAGALPRVMNELADYLEAREAVGQKFALAMLYPTVVTIVAMLVIGGLMIYVVPQIASVFTNSRQELPFLTRALLGTSNFLREAWPALALLVVAAIVAFQRVYAQPDYRRRIQRRLLRLPLIGRMLKLEAGASFGRTLSILLDGGVPMLQALAATRDGARLDVFRDAISATSDHVREGSTLARALETKGLFPPLLIHFIANGESGGDLPKLLQHAARQLQNELEHRMGWMSGLIEPLLIVVMGGIVMVIVLAVLMPIIEMSQLTK
jgi:general secretion pathway protein F